MAGHCYLVSHYSTLRQAIYVPRRRRGGRQGAQRVQEHQITGHPHHAKARRRCDLYTPGTRSRRRSARACMRTIRSGRRMLVPTGRDAHFLWARSLTCALQSCTVGALAWTDLRHNVRGICQVCGGASRWTGRSQRMVLPCSRRLLHTILHSIHQG